MAETAVRHEPERQRFVLELEGLEGELTYARLDDGRLDYNHTFVPPSLRGRGVAGRLARYALDYAAEHGLSIVPSCPYIRRFIEKNPGYAPLVRESQPRRD